MSQNISSDVDGCPCCGETDIDESVREFEGICTVCGFVIHDKTNISSPDWLITETPEEESEDKEWLSVCRVRNATEQQLVNAFEELENISTELNLPVEIRQEIAEIYCDAFRVKTTDGRDTTSFVAACIRIGSMKIGQPIPRGRLTELQGVDKSKFHQSYVAIQDELNLSFTPPVATEYLWFIDRILNFTKSDTQIVQETLKAVDADQSLVGKDPVGIVAAAAYLSDADFTQADIAYATGVSTETIRLRAKQIKELVHHD